MVRKDILEEHLNNIYLTEDVNNLVNKLKSQGKNIADSAKNGNILKFNRAFDSIPVIPDEELISFTSKKMSVHYKNSKKYVNVKMKKAPEGIKELIIIARASLDKLRSEVDDPDIREKINSTLEKLDERIEKVTPMLVKEGISLIFIASLLSMLLGDTLFIVPLLERGGTVGVVSGVLLYVISRFVKIFIEAKKAGKRTIS